MKTTNRIVLIGPESSGKSTLCEQLSAYFNCAWVPEYAREYLEEKGSTVYELSDLEVIAKGQVERIHLAEEQSPNMLFCDTDLVTIHIWSLDKFDCAIPFVEEKMRMEKADLYLVCKPDLPWEYDPLREDSNRREELFDWNNWVLQSINANTFIVCGEGENRLQNAIAGVTDYLLSQNSN